MIQFKLITSIGRYVAERYKVYLNTSSFRLKVKYIYEGKPNYF